MSQTIELTQDATSTTGEALIQVRTSRFGTLEVERERVLRFERGLLGFPTLTRFILFKAGEENYFFWLQSTEDPTLAFVVTDPSIFVKGYDVPLKEEARADLAVTDDADIQVFVICNKVNGFLTGNMLGPVVVNGRSRQAQQVVLTEKKWSTRQPLMQLREQPTALAA